MIKPRLELVKKDYNTKIRTGKGKDNKSEIIRTGGVKGLNWRVILNLIFSKLKSN